MRWSCDESKEGSSLSCSESNRSLALASCFLLPALTRTGCLGRLLYWLGAWDFMWCAWGARRGKEMIANAARQEALALGILCP